MTTHHIDLDHLTVIATDENGESFDLNATGEPCTSLSDLRDFVVELHGQRAFDVDTMRSLLNDCGSPRFVRA